MRAREGVGSMRAAATVLTVAAVGLSACDREEPYGPDIDARAAVVAQAFLDYDGQNGIGGADEPAPGLRFQVLLPGSGTPVAEGVADADGLIDLDQIPVGTYDLRVAPSFLGDSLVVTQLDSARITLTPDAVRNLQVGVTPPTLSVAEARQLPQGRRVWVRGMVLNTRGNSVDGAVHLLQEGVGAMRVVFPAAAAGFPGDSARALGVTVGTGARRYLVDGRINILAQAVRPIIPLELSIGAARTAGGGIHDARLVLVRGGTVTDTATIPFVGQEVTVTDGPDRVVVLLADQNGFGTDVVPGTPANAIQGLLVPDPGSSDWRIVPRSQGDVAFGPPPPPPPGGD